MKAVCILTTWLLSLAVICVVMFLIKYTIETGTLFLVNLSIKIFGKETNDKKQSDRKDAL